MDDLFICRRLMLVYTTNVGVDDLSFFRIHFSFDGTDDAASLDEDNI